jgi:hypothetical protein
MLASLASLEALVALADQFQASSTSQDTFGKGTCRHRIDKRTRRTSALAKRNKKINRAQVSVLPQNRPLVPQKHPI